MILGLSVSAFTQLHVVVSLIAMVAGLVVIVDMLAGRWRRRWTAFFLATTVFTSATGFLFPTTVLTPALIFGVVSMVVLAAAIYALYARRLAGPWRSVYVGCATFAFYLNVFVGVVQAFQKLDSLSPLAPTQTEPAFLAAQAIVLAAVVVAGVLATRRFRPVA